MSGALRVATPQAWLETAVREWPALLLDHAYCEKKAASSALALIFGYPECERDNLVLARLAREELRHFEQVTRLMQRLGVPFQRLRPGRYAGALRGAVRTHEPQRRVDLLLVSALIEERSCERFRLLAPRLPGELGGFYADLERAEARHSQLYWQQAAAAATLAGLTGLQARWDELAEVEGQLISASDEQFRFHSGPPPLALPALDCGPVRGSSASS
jgi:tRNA-(ms[2]io[6]A)-hydroxylase